MVFLLDRMVKDEVIYSPANIFEMLFKRFKKSKSIHSTSVYFALTGICRSVIDEIKKTYHYQEHSIKTNTFVLIT